MARAGASLWVKKLTKTFCQSHVLERSWEQSFCHRSSREAVVTSEEGAMLAWSPLPSLVTLLTWTTGMCGFRRYLGNWVGLFLLLGRQKTPYSIAIHVLRFYFYYFQLCACACECRCLSRPKAWNPSAAGIISSCEPCEMGVGNWTWSVLS